MDKISFDDFLKEVHPAYAQDIVDMHQALTGLGCKTEIKQAKSGYVLSYIVPGSKKTLANYIFRKSGMLARIYADNLGSYADILEGIPEDSLKAVKKAPACKRLLDPTKCNSRCSMGYTFSINGEQYQKCRYGAFTLPIEEGSWPFISEFMRKELDARLA